MAFGLFHMACFCTKTLNSAESTERAFTFPKKKKEKAMQYLHAQSRVWSGGHFTLSTGTPIGQVVGAWAQTSPC